MVVVPAILGRRLREEVMAAAVLIALEKQAKACTALRAPFYAGLLAHVEQDAAHGGITARLLAGWTDATPEQAVSDAVALRLLAALHYLALSGAAPDLAAEFPPQGSDADKAWPAARAALAANEALAAGLMAHEPQTNEVRRSACLLGGFLQIARETGLPLRCFEIGASAGLNSLWDKFRYRIGEAAWGDAASPITLDSRWEGDAAPALDFGAVVVERQACDRRPVDIRDPADATRLLSYVWPEQAERLARLRVAIELGRAIGLAVEAQDAAVFARRATPARGVATVVFHSVVMPYMPAATQAEFRQVLEAHGARATPEAPFAWLRMEPDADFRSFELRLALWPAGEDRRLADVHPHGEFAIWR
jgi:hypothetical protein